MPGEPVVFAEIQQNRGGAIIRVVLSESDGRAFCDIQDLRPANGGGLEKKPREKLSLGVHLLADLATALEQARRIPCEQGLT